MRLNLVYIKSQINMQSYNEVHSQIGFLIKKNRLARKMTLSDLAKNICSISYLSKVENNKITVSDDYFSKLCKRLNIAYQRSFDTKIDYSYLLREFLVHSWVSDKNKYLFTNIEHYRTSLINFGYTILKHDIFKVSNLFFEIKPFIKNFNKSETNFFLTVLAIYNFRIGDYAGVFDALSMLDNPNKYEHILKEIYQLKAAFKMNKFVYLLSNFENISNIVKDNHYFEFHKKLDFLYLQYLARLQNYDVINKKLEDNHYYNQAEKDLIVAINYYASNNCLKAIKHLKPYLNQKDYYLIYLYSLDKLTDKKAIIQALKNIDFIFVLPENLYFVEYLKLKYLHEKSQVEDFFRNIFFESKIKISNTNFLKYLENEAVIYFTAKHFYKDALMISVANRQFMENLISI